MSSDTHHVPGHESDSAQQVDHLAHDPSRGATPVFPVLDALRAVGAFAVVLTHVTFWTGDYLRHGIVGRMLPRLDVGVAIFFVLSGFLLAHQYFAAASRGRAHDSVGRYYWKRFLRIYPPYVIGVVPALVFVGANAGADLGDWASVLTLTDIYTSDALRPGMTQMWSLATEVSFYALLPLLMLVAGATRGRRPTTRRVALLLGALVVLNVVWTLVLDERVPEAALSAQWLPNYLMWFCAGMALAWIHVLATRPGGAPRLHWLFALARQPGVCWALAVSLLVLAATPISGPMLFDPPTAAEALTRQVLYAFIGGLIVLTGVFPDERSRYARVMSRRLPRRLGHISYGVFCLHLVVLHFVYWATPFTMFEGTDLFPVLGLTLLITLPLAELLYRFVEVPAMRLRHLGSATARKTPPSATTLNS